MIGEEQEVKVDEVVVLEKFEGDPEPENLTERIHIKNGEVVAVEKVVDGEIVSTETVKEVE